MRLSAKHEILKLMRLVVLYWLCNVFESLSTSSWQSSCFAFYMDSWLLSCFIGLWFGFQTKLTITVYVQMLQMDCQCFSFGYRWEFQIQSSRPIHCNKFQPDFLSAPFLSVLWQWYARLACFVCPSQFTSLATTNIVCLDLVVLIILSLKGVTMCLTLIEDWYCKHKPFVNWGM